MKSEFEEVKNLKYRFQLDKVGDDAAILPQSGETDLVITTDLLIEDIDFRTDWCEPEDIGHKSLAVSLSDLAAMGSRARWGLASLGLTREAWQSGFVERFYEGWHALAGKFGVELVGGDLSESADRIVVDSIACGESKRGCAVRRDGARPGDLVCVSGSLGGAAAGLILLNRGVRAQSADGAAARLINRQLKPQPRNQIGEFLGVSGVANSMIDISDGLSGDLQHVCDSSGVGARIMADSIPIDRDIEAVLGVDRDSAFDLALHGGEDFELLFTAGQTDAIPTEHSNSITVIGEITQSKDILLIWDDRETPMQRRSYQHFE